MIEISVESAESFEDAIRQGVGVAAESVRQIKGTWVKEPQVVVEDGKITTYRVDLKVSVALE